MVTKITSTTAAQRYIEVKTDDAGADEAIKTKDGVLVLARLRRRARGNFHRSTHRRNVLEKTEPFGSCLVSIVSTMPPGGNDTVSARPAVVSFFTIPSVGNRRTQTDRSPLTVA